MKSLDEYIAEARDPCELEPSKLAIELEMKNRSGNILVEGTSDEKFFKKYFDNSKARFFPDKQERVVNEKKAKEKINFVFKELRKRKFPNSKYFCITDRDYDCFRKRNFEKKFAPNWFYVDKHSLETWILSDNNNFQKLIDHAKINWIDSEKLRILEQRQINIKEIIFNIATNIGVLRLISLREKGLNISFNGAFRKSSNFLKFLSPENVLNKKTPFDKKNFINFLFHDNNNLIKGTKLNIENVFLLYEKEINYRKGISPDLLAHGHDLCKIIHVFFSHKLLSGSQDQVLKNEKDFDPKEGGRNSVELYVQKLMNEHFFKNSNLYANIKSSQYYAESLMI